MKKIGKSIFPIFFAFWALTVSFQAQGQKNEIGFGLGGMIYRGEISPKLSPAFYRPAGNIFYRANLSPAVAIRIPLSIGRLYASDENFNTPVANLRKADFFSSIIEAAVMVEYNFFDYRARQESRKFKNSKRFTPYLTGGLATFRADGDKTNNKISGISIPIGGGFKYKLTEYLNFGGEFVCRKTFTNKIDGLTNGKTSVSIDNDWYYYTGFTLSYTFYSINCPEFYK